MKACLSNKIVLLGQMMKTEDLLKVCLSNKNSPVNEKKIRRNMEKRMRNLHLHLRVPFDVGVSLLSISQGSRCVNYWSSFLY